jgi:hypothetical protein
MRNHKHFGTPQENSFIGDIVRCIAEHGGLREWEKDLLINRITAPIDEPESPEVVRAKEGISRPAAHEPADMPTPNDAPSSSVARKQDTTEPLTMSITRDDDGHMCIAIADRKWKIMRHGIIGNGAADREEFHQAASDLVDNELQFSDEGREKVVLFSEWDENYNARRFYRIAKCYRASLEMTLGQVAYEAFVSTSPSSDHQAWDLLGGIEKTRWEVAGQAAYLSIGLDPSEINRELQVLAARKRMLLLRSVYCGTTGIGNVASDIALIAGPTPQPKP